MRLPKFRCKNKVGNWCFFTVLHNGNVNEENFVLETLSEFTGLFDKQGVEIYEGDIMCDYDNEIIGTVEFVKGAFYVHSLHEKEFYDLWDFSCEEVIGNIYENSELLEKR